MPERHRPGWLDHWLWIDHDQIPVIMRLAPTIAVGSLVLWWFESHSPGMSQWDLLGSPLVSCVILLSALLLTRRPVWRTPAVFAAMLAASVYLMGKVIWHLHFPQANQIYALMSVAIYAPLIYLSAFAIFKRGARLFCWAHYAATLLLLLVTEIWPLGPRSDLVLQTKIMMLVISPAYIVSLSFSVRLREAVNAKERAAHEDKERMLAMMSHEIRGPLQTMLSSVDLLATKVSDEPSRRALGRVSRVAQQLDRQLKDLLEFTRVNHPDLAIENTTFDLVALIDNVRETHQATAQAKSLSLHVVQPEQAPAAAERALWHQATGDPARLTQVLDNLVSNALKYTVVGQITLSLSTPPRRPGWAVIEVSDTGVGIAPQDLAAIFEPFVRVIPPRMTPPEGSGLGLVIARRLVNRLGGQLQVRSTPGQGSVFSVLLPLNGAPAVGGR